MNRSGKHWWLCVIAACACACDSTARADPDELDRLPQWQMEEELRIGSTHDAELGFSDIAGIALGPDSLLYVLDMQERQIRVFDRAGERVRTFARRGNGPGELEEPETFGFVGDTLWVLEMTGNRRVTLFATNGSVIATVPGIAKPFTGKTGRLIVNVVPASLEPGGTLTSTYWYTAFGGSAGDTVIFPRVRFDLRGQVIDTIGWDTLGFGVGGPTMTIDGVTASPPGRPFLFDDDPVESADGRVRVDRLLPGSAEPSRFTVTMLGASGDTMWRREYSYRPARRTTKQVDDAVAAAGSSFRFRGADSLHVDRAIRNAIDIPEFLPPVTRVRIVDGEVWLRREDTGGEWRWTILSHQGEPLGSIILPRTVNPRILTSRTVWGIVTDDMDVPWIVRYRIRR